ncbi:MAG: SHOCT domain-containing protein [Acidimicrobiales bacterium]
MPYQFHQHHGMDWGRGLLAFLFVLLVLAAVAWFAVTFSRQSSHTRHGLVHPHGAPASHSSDAMKILNERFAKGEIDAEEFTKRRDLLQSSP